MATPQQHSHWEDDERNTRVHISYHSDDEEPYIPVYKILKQMYDEEKEALYVYDSYDEYNFGDTLDDYIPLYEEWDTWSETYSHVSADVPTTDTEELPVVEDEAPLTDSKYCYY